jgi:hypothetical protein
VIENSLPIVEFGCDVLGLDHLRSTDSGVWRYLSLRARDAICTMWATARSVCQHLTQRRSGVTNKLTTGEMELRANSTGAISDQPDPSADLECPGRELVLPVLRPRPRELHRGRTAR